ncbi:PREDICTED: early nodulin-like protein 2 [Tarenaya hassleriana]|uniref:early nodulin-like protein 2 n=1 Tax=Tarenaya hassleriana TaxID=28532 RepID=UPI00053C7292|nr:PREDICTED: early nodulin-like protein 2 [Tarenaya hassleriana]
MTLVSYRFHLSVSSSSSSSATMGLCLKTVSSFVFIVSFAFFSVSEARRFYVGGNGGWVINPPENYNTWAEKSRFSVNDTLYFKYAKGSDSVLQVSKTDYFSCNSKNPIKKMEDGESEFMFARSGPFYFISGNEDHCKKGQKLIVVVLSVRSKPPHADAPAKSPSSSPSPVHHSPTVSPSHAPAKSPSSSPSPVHHPPTVSPSKSPAKSPSSSPSPVPHSPTVSPSKSPAKSPSNPPSSPSPVPHSPTASPSHAPAKSPSTPRSSPSPASPAPSTKPPSSPKASPSPAPVGPPPELPPKSSPSPTESPNSSDDIMVPAPAPAKSSGSMLAVMSVTTALSMALTVFMSV